MGRPLSDQMAARARFRRHHLILRALRFISPRFAKGRSEYLPVRYPAPVALPLRGERHHLMAPRRPLEFDLGRPTFDKRRLAGILSPEDRYPFELTGTPCIDRIIYHLSSIICGKTSLFVGRPHHLVTMRATLAKSAVPCEGLHKPRKSPVSAETPPICQRLLEIV